MNKDLIKFGIIMLLIPLLYVLLSLFLPFFKFYQATNIILDLLFFGGIVLIVYGLITGH